MEVLIKLHDLPSGELIRVYIWDPTITQLPKESKIAMANKQ